MGSYCSIFLSRSEWDVILCTAVLLEQRSLLLARFKYKQRFCLICLEFSGFHFQTLSLLQNSRPFISCFLNNLCFYVGSVGIFFIVLPVQCGKFLGFCCNSLSEAWSISVCILTIYCILYICPIFVDWNEARAKP